MVSRKLTMRRTFLTEHEPNKLHENSWAAKNNVVKTKVAKKFTAKNIYNLLESYWTNREFILNERDFLKLYAAVLCQLATEYRHRHLLPT